MVRLRVDGTPECFAPRVRRLSRETEHEVDVYLRNAGLAEQGDAFLNLIRTVFAPQQFQLGFIKTLRAE